MTLSGVLSVATIGCGGGGGGGDGGGSSATPTPVITSNGGGDTASINVNENEVAVTTVAATSSEDINYTIGGGGDGASFDLNITSGALTFVAAPDFEVPTDTGADNNYTVLVVATSTSGIEDNQTINIDIVDKPNATDIALSSSTVAENSTTNTVIGTLSNNSDDNETAVYTLVAGDGDGDNGLVKIVGDELQVNGAIDFETNPTLEIRVNVNEGTKNFSKAFTINVTDVNEAPTDIALSSSTIAENSAAGTDIGTLSNTDEDTGDTHTYTLKTGKGGPDNSLFSISGTTLKVAGAIDFENDNSLEIQINVNDGVNDYAEVMTINVTDVNTAPTDINITSSSIDENEPANTVVGILGATDDGENTGTLTYSFDGGTDDANFTIDGTNLKINAIPDFETKSSYSINIKVSDGVLDYTETFAIIVNDIDETVFVMKIKTDNTGTSGDDQFTIPTHTTPTYNYEVDCAFDGSFDATVIGQTGDYTCDYAGSSGEKTIAIKGLFPHIYFSGGGDKDKLLDVKQWGDIAWTNMYRAFYGCSNFNITAVDSPDLSGATSMGATFQEATAFNSNIADWNVTTIEYLSNLFEGATSFNQDISAWQPSSLVSTKEMFKDATSFNQDVSWTVPDSLTNTYGMFENATAFDGAFGSNWDFSNVITLQYMFRHAPNFDQDISGWDTGKVTNMRNTFEGATAFNQDISGWDTGSVTTMNYMFNLASSFDQPIGEWNTTNVADFGGILRNTASFNQNINWDLTSANSFYGAFALATNFNGSFGAKWDTTNVTAFGAMFTGATSFNQDISSWNMTNVNLISYMFLDATAFAGQDLSSWNLDNVSAGRCAEYNNSTGAGNTWPTLNNCTP